ncbi:hypothetical protein CCHR01_11119 [Colletotrichum chrysophilum]|uniref:Uncharacterized protein n=1 Tax=Colletotrichum chrysophilum TaxID=1836956 RepID=A0AAD9EF42_9PEZI|nr:hypothetical protein CCHR01_11119 [Colletotrichum chrysophilum]
MKFSIIALIVPLVAGAAIQERQVSPECEKWGSLDHPYPFATQWGQYFLCCNYLGPNDVSFHRPFYTLITTTTLPAVADLVA